ncbi:MAG: hypothetical protein WCO60_20210 [Verrucomicrobiota bacterium]
MLPSKLEENFWRFHERQPQVFSLLVDKANEMLNSGEKTLSISRLFEQIRHDPSIPTPAGQIKLNNNQRAYYARLLVTLYPHFKDRFRLRTQRVQATFGPENHTLPSGTHYNN